MLTVVSSDIFIELGTVHVTIQLNVDGKVYAASTALSVEQAEQNTEGGPEPVFTVVEL